MADLVGYADCPECRKKAGVFQGKRHLHVDCKPEFGGDGCSVFKYQSKVAQKKLRNRTRFISESPACDAGLPEVEPMTAPDVVPAFEPPEPKLETPPEPKPAKKRWSLFK